MVEQQDDTLYDTIATFLDPTAPEVTTVSPEVQVDRFNEDHDVPQYCGWVKGVPLVANSLSVLSGSPNQKVGTDNFPVWDFSNGERDPIKGEQMIAGHHVPLIDNLNVLEVGFVELSRSVSKVSKIGEFIQERNKLAIDQKGMKIGITELGQQRKTYREKLSDDIFAKMVNSELEMSEGVLRTTGKARHRFIAHKSCFDPRMYRENVRNESRTSDTMLEMIHTERKLHQPWNWEVENALIAAAGGIVSKEEAAKVSKSFKRAQVHEGYHFVKTEFIKYLVQLRAKVLKNHQLIKLVKGNLKRLGDKEQFRNDLKQKRSALPAPLVVKEIVPLDLSALRTKRKEAVSNMAAAAAREKGERTILRANMDDKNKFVFAQGARNKARLRKLLADMNAADVIDVVQKEGLVLADVQPVRLGNKQMEMDEDSVELQPSASGETVLKETALKHTGTIRELIERRRVSSSSSSILKQKVDEPPVPVVPSSNTATLKVFDLYFIDNGITLNDTANEIVKVKIIDARLTCGASAVSYRPTSKKKAKAFALEFYFRKTPEYKNAKLVMDVSVSRYDPKTPKRLRQTLETQHLFTTTIPIKGSKKGVTVQSESEKQEVPELHKYFAVGFWYNLNWVGHLK